jgi:hypothetical protein
MPEVFSLRTHTPQAKTALCTSPRDFVEKTVFVTVWTKAQKIFQVRLCAGGAMHNLVCLNCVTITCNLLKCLCCSMENTAAGKLISH